MAGGKPPGDIRAPSRPANMVTPEGCGSGLSGWQVRRLLAEEPVKSARYLAFRVYQWSPSDGKRSPRRREDGARPGREGRPADRQFPAEPAEGRTPQPDLQD